jgi:hypothetical protein
MDTIRRSSKICTKDIKPGKDLGIVRFWNMKTILEIKNNVISGK